MIQNSISVVTYTYTHNLRETLVWTLIHTTKLSLEIWFTHRVHLNLLKHNLCIISWSIWFWLISDDTARFASDSVTTRFLLRRNRFIRLCFTVGITYMLSIKINAKKVVNIHNNIFIHVPVLIFTCNSKKWAASIYTRNKYIWFVCSMSTWLR